MHIQTALHTAPHVIPTYPLHLSHRAKILIASDNIQDIATILDVCEAGDIVFVDIDDTIHTIDAYLFQTSPTTPLSPGTQIIEEIKQNRLESFPAFISRWRLSRRIQLVNQHWPELIAQAKQRGVLIYGITQMDTGFCGVMSRVEEWRYNELCKLNIHFTPHYEQMDDVVLSPERSDPLSNIPASPAVFYKGIFFTGSIATDKKTILEIVMQHHLAKRVVLIDDRMQQIQAAQSLSMNCAFTGIVFRGVDRVIRPAISPELYDKVTHLQKQYLYNEQWLENDEALLILDHSPCLTPVAELG
jgi:hypothetical protein